MNDQLTCFKTYDIRGILGEELDEDIAYRIGRAYAHHFRPTTIAVGGDSRETSHALKLAIGKGLMDGGVDVVDLGLTGTEEIYFAAFNLPIDGGIQVTTSHNPINYNGMKLVGPKAVPISRNSGLNEVQDIAEKKSWESEDTRLRQGKYTTQSLKDKLIEHYLSYIDYSKFTPLKLLVNAGNGAAGPLIDEIEKVFKLKNIPIEFCKICHDPNPAFPNGIPNPLLLENRNITSEAVIESNADLGIAWDGDFDRCFLFDENGNFIEGYYIVGLLAEAFLSKHPKAKIIHDPRLYWGTEETIKKCGGKAIMSKTGHAFIKEIMRKENAVFGGEMSAHYYFRDFSFCDSGMIPWLLIAELMCEKKATLSTLVKERIDLYPSSGEINFKVGDPEKITDNVIKHYQTKAIKQDFIDGVSFEFENWRFNLRKSNTEPLLRLNLESRNSKALLAQKTKELKDLIQQESKA